MSLQVGARLGPYEVLSLLGSGGMGEVYRARDVRLGRDVAVKVLAGSFADDSVRLHRFEREARSIAALSHPNVLAIFDVGQEPVPFLVTELLDGETLRSVLDRGPVPLSRLTDVALQCTAGLAAAHARGIVHRDLKPANVFITLDDVVKILDFGLAKAVFAGPLGVLGHDVTAAPTLEGTIVGTLAYMSPEQVRGGDADPRSDLFACGAILYEMLTGRRAFQGDSPADTISAILREQPPESEFRGQIPPALVRIIRRCLEKDPDRRFQSARELRAAIESLSGVGPAAVAKSGERSVAVLPFADMSVQKDQEYFCEGMAEELINALAKLPQLRVASRTSAFRFKGAQDVHQMGRQLGVDAVVEGSVRTSGKRLRVSARLTNVADGYQIWSDRYDRDLDDVFAVQDEIARAIVDNLKLKLGGSTDTLVKRPTDNLEAYNLYLQGRYQWIRRNAMSLQRAATLFERVVAQDSSYALAYAGLADSYMTLGHYGILRMIEAYAKAKPAADRAVALDPDLAEAHQAMAQTLWLFERDGIGAEREYRHALERKPESGLIRSQFAVMLSWYGRIDEAISEAHTGCALEPVSPLVGAYQAVVFLVAGEYDASLDQCRRLIDLDPRYVLAPWVEALVRGKMSQHDQAAEAAERAATLSSGQTFFLAALGAAHGAAGRLDSARAVLAELEERSRREYVQPIHFGEVYAAMGEADVAFDWLNRAYAEHNSFLGLAVANPAYDSVRSDARVVDLGGRTVIPGLIDAHVHLLIAVEIVDEPSLRNYERTVLPQVMSGFISHGITTVRSTGDPLPYIAELRGRMEQAVTGPRVVMTGGIPSSPDGHPATTVCQGNPFCRQRVAREVKNEEEARQAVRELARANVNAVKVVVDDVIAKVPALSDAILAALVDETHRQKLRIIAHVSVTNDIAATKRLVELGLDEFVHPPINIFNAGKSASEIVATLAGRAIPVTTTMSGFDGYTDAKGVERTLMGGGPYPPQMRQQFDGLLDAIRRLADADVKLVVGTDWFNGPIKLENPNIRPGAFTLHEMDLLRRAGLSPQAVLTAATRNAAEALGVIDKLGTISEGKLADLAVLDGDLQQDFSALHRTVAVFKSGRIAHGSLP